MGGGEDYIFSIIIGPGQMALEDRSRDTVPINPKLIILTSLSTLHISESGMKSLYPQILNDKK